MSPAMSINPVPTSPPTIDQNNNPMRFPPRHHFPTGLFGCYKGQYQAALNSSWPTTAPSFGYPPSFLPFRGTAEATPWGLPPGLFIQGLASLTAFSLHLLHHFLAHRHRVPHLVRGLSSDEFRPDGFLVPRRHLGERFEEVFPLHLVSSFSR